MDRELENQGISTRQRIYDFIVDFITERGYSPSIREICKGTDIKSTSAVYEHLLVLEVMNKIHMEKGKLRTISLVGYKLVKIE